MDNLPSLLEKLRCWRVIDLSQALQERMPIYPAHSKFFHNLWSSYWHGDRSLTYQLNMNEHTGTHVDAPAHFVSDTKPEAHVTIDQVPLDRLIGRGVRIDCRKFRERELVERDFVTGWEKEHGAIQAGDIVLFNFGWPQHWALRPQGKRYTDDWPGVSMAVAAYLIEKSVSALGVDTLSPDVPEALRAAPIHPVILEKQVLIVENLCNLSELPDFFLFVALPLKIQGGSGSPVRAIAFV